MNGHAGVRLMTQIVHDGVLGRAQPTGAAALDSYGACYYNIKTAPGHSLV